MITPGVLTAGDALQNLRRDALDFRGLAARLEDDDVAVRDLAVSLNPHQAVYGNPAARRVEALVVRDLALRIAVSADAQRADRHVVAGLLRRPALLEPCLGATAARHVVQALVPGDLSLLELAGHHAGKLAAASHPAAQVTGQKLGALLEPHPIGPVIDDGQRAVQKCRDVASR